jgi:pimeloyl-ACP methyl ester carboxylesterase
MFGLFTARFVRQKKAIAPPSVSPPRLVDVQDVLTTTELSDLTTVFQDDKPEGKFLLGRHGSTHFIYERNNNKNKGMVILGHGLGASLKNFKPFADILLKNGFSVLRYDIFGHGYSKYNGEDMWIKYTPDMFVDQLEDLVDFVCEQEKDDVVAFIGHSNGGVNGISANSRWTTEGSQRKAFPKLILVSPSIYAKKPILAQISDSIPRVMISLMKTIPPMKALIGDNYLELMKEVFGKDSENNEYNFPEAFQANMDNNLRLFGRVEGVKEHPFRAAAILGVSSYNIPGALLPLHQENFKKLLQMDGDNKTKNLFVWGDLDISVPYKLNIDKIQTLAEENDNLSLKVLQNLSHEIFMEDASAVATAVLPFLESD